MANRNTRRANKLASKGRKTGAGNGINSAILRKLSGKKPLTPPKGATNKH